MPTPTTPPAITAVPTPQPVRNDRTTFSPRVDALVTWLPTHITDLIAALINVYDNAVSAYDSAVAALADKNTATTQAGIATAQAAAASASAQTAINAPGTSATSTTSLELSLGPKTLTIQTGKLLNIGMPVNIIYTTTPTIYMHGIITAYNSGTGALSVAVTKVDGAATTYTAWTISLVGNAGADGVNGRDYINGATTLVAGITYDLDSSAGTFTALMPFNPGIGDSVTLDDPLGTLGTNKVVLGRNSSNFVDPYGAGQAEDFELNINNLSVTFIYTASGWRAA